MITIIFSILVVVSGLVAFILLLALFDNLEYNRSKKLFNDSATTPLYINSTDAETIYKLSLESLRSRFKLRKLIKEYYTNWSWYHINQGLKKVHSTDFYHLPGGFIGLVIYQSGEIILDDGSLIHEAKTRHKELVSPTAKDVEKYGKQLVSSLSSGSSINSGFLVRSFPEINDKSRKNNENKNSERSDTNE